MTPTTELEIHRPQADLIPGDPIPGDSIPRDRIPNVFFKQEANTRHLALILPGMRYSVHMPLLYYARLLLWDRGADVLLVDTNYERVPSKDLVHEASQDAEAALLAGMAQREYTRLTLIGKSLGTWSVARLVAGGQPLPNRVDCIWLTPMLNNPEWRQLVICGKRLNLIVTGTADSYYQAAALSEIERSAGCYKMVVEGADHLLEIPGKANETLKVLQRYLKTLDAFLWEEHRSKWAWM